MRFSTLGQVPAHYTEEALSRKLEELNSLRAQRKAIEDQIIAVRTGKSPEEEKARAQGLPGGTVTLPIVGKVPVLAVGAAGVLGLLLMRR